MCTNENELVCIELCGTIENALILDQFCFSNIGDAPGLRLIFFNYLVNSAIHSL